MESAKDKLRKLTAWSEEPTLADAEIDELLIASGVADQAGNGPQTDGWGPTYDIDAAAAEGWMIKAARAASTTETDPASLSVTSRVFDNCLRMARHYRRKRTASSVTI